MAPLSLMQMKMVDNFYTWDIRCAWVSFLSCTNLFNPIPFKWKLRSQTDLRWNLDDRLQRRRRKRLKWKFSLWRRLINRVVDFGDSARGGLFLIMALEDFPWIGSDKAEKTFFFRFLKLSLELFIFMVLFEDFKRIFSAELVFIVKTRESTSQKRHTMKANKKSKNVFIDESFQKLHFTKAFKIAKFQFQSNVLNLSVEAAFRTISQTLKNCGFWRTIRRHLS